MIHVPQRDKETIYEDFYIFASMYSLSVDIPFFILNYCDTHFDSSRLEYLLYKMTNTLHRNKLTESVKNVLTDCQKFNMCLRLYLF